jgi:hypothetical protein
MPDPDRLLNTLRRATAAFRDMPGRQGHLVEAADVDEILVAGDLHGNLDNFRKLIAAADLARQPRRHFVLQEVVHGDHRYLLHAYGDRADDVLAAYWQMLDAAPLAVRSANRVFLSHSLPPHRYLGCFDLAVLRRDHYDEADVQPGGPVHSLLWGRDTVAETAKAFLDRVDADLLITGHIPCDAGFEIANPHQLILDCIGTPAAYCLFPTSRPLTIDELAALVHPL